MKFIPYSYSKIQVYQTCPKQFKYKFIDKITPKPKNLEPLLKGSAVHNILEKHPEAPTHKLAPKYQHIADAFLETDTAKEIFSSTSVREQRIGLDKDFEPCEYKSKEAIFRGIVDFITILNSKLHIIDYKTGKYKEQCYQSYDQLMFYSIYFFKKYLNIDTIIINYVYIEHSETYNKLTLERKYLDNYIRQLHENINNIETDTEFCKNNSKLCDYCDFLEHCSKNI